MPATLEAPVLLDGERMARSEFHRRYERMPDGFRAELIGGVVHISPRVTALSGRNRAALGAAFCYYTGVTHGTQALSGVTVLLDDDNEPQPDICLRILPAFGGQSGDTEDDYISGAPELVCEISDSTRSLDLNAKKRQYAAAGVLEYLVLNLRDNRLYWFDLKADRELTADPDGIIRVKVFPGLWIDPAAVIARDLRALLATLDKGLASPDHAAFVAKLAAAKAAQS